MLTWLRGAEILSRFSSGEEARQTIERLILDRGIVGTRRADPAVDLFRLDRIVHRFYGRHWRPDVSTIDWRHVTIDAPGTSRPIGTPAVIEASEHLLQAFLKGAPIASTAAAATACEHWLRSEGDTLTGQAKPAIRQAAMSRFRGLSGRAFDLAWAKAAPAEFRRAGAKAKARG